MKQESPKKTSWTAYHSRAGKRVRKTGGLGALSSCGGGPCFYCALLILILFTTTIPPWAGISMEALRAYSDGQICG
jgi:hypothetical protein